MSRVWYQWIDGNKVVWPADELPHPKAIFKANFINQFIAWIRYLNYIGPLVGHIPDYIAAGDIIQGASFWNSLIINPKTDTFGQWSYRWQYTLSDLTKTGPLPYSSIKNLYEINGWEEATTPLISRGDNLQRMIRVWLRNLRWKLDRCSTYYNTNASGHMKVCEWVETKDGKRREKWTDYGNDYWVTPTILMWAHSTGGYSGKGWQFSEIHTTAKQAFCTLFALIYSYDSSEFPFPYPGENNYEILAAGAGGVTYESTLPTYMPVWDKFIDCGLDITQAFTAYDYLPAGFEAPE